MSTEAINTIFFICAVVKITGLSVWLMVRGRRRRALAMEREKAERTRVPIGGAPRRRPQEQAEKQPAQPRVNLQPMTSPPMGGPQHPEAPPRDRLAELRKLAEPRPPDTRPVHVLFWSTMMAPEAFCSAAEWPGDRIAMVLPGRAPRSLGVTCQECLDLWDALTPEERSRLF